MLLPGCHIIRTCLFLTVLIAAVVSYPFPGHDKTFNFKIGFDITKGANGAPEVLVRDFEDSQESNVRRAGSIVGLKYKKVNPAESSASSASSEEQPGAKVKASAEAKEETGGKPVLPPVAHQPKNSNEDDNDDDADSDVDAKHSTRGLNPEDFEPEVDKYRHGNDDDDDDQRRRSKRAADIFSKYYNDSIIKRKHKKALHVSSKPHRTTHVTPYVF